MTPTKLERRQKLDALIKSGANLTQEQTLEAVMLMAFRDDGEPRDFAPKELRELLLKMKYFKEIFEQGFDE